MFLKRKSRIFFVALLFFFSLLAVYCFPMKFHVVQAKGRILYKCVSTAQVNTAEEYESLLNDMAGEGWEFDHIILKANIATFRKSR